jgi:hemerythrin
MTWTNKLSTGIEWQDEDHRQLLAQLDRLVEAMKQSSARTEIPRIVDFLEKYAESHFTREESLIRENALSGLGNHSMEHQEFRKKTAELRLAFDRQGGSSYVVLHIKQLLSEWLVRHIQQTDKKMAAEFLAKTAVH